VNPLHGFEEALPAREMQWLVAKMVGHIERDTLRVHPPNDGEVAFANSKVDGAVAFIIGHVDCDATLRVQPLGNVEVPFANGEMNGMVSVRIGCVEWGKADDVEPLDEVEVTGEARIVHR